MCEPPAPSCTQNDQYKDGYVDTLCNGSLSGTAGFLCSSPEDCTHPNSAGKGGIEGVQYNSNISLCQKGYKYVGKKGQYKDPNNLGCSDVTVCGYPSQGPFCVNSYTTAEACTMIQPEMNTQSMLECCLGKPKDNNWLNCARDYCPNNPLCGNKMAEYCSGNAVTPEECIDYLGKTTLINNQKKVVNAVLDEWMQNPNPETNLYMEEMINLCATDRTVASGVCDAELREFCKNVTRDEANSNENIQKLCGCFLPTSDYEEFNKLLQETGGTGIAQICDPLCTTSLVQRGNNCTTDRCASAICVIDLNNIEVEEKLKNGVDVSQVCVAQESGSSQCYIAVDGGKLPTNIKIGQNCGDCYIYDPKQPYKTGTNPKPVPCQGRPGPGPGPKPSPGSGITRKELIIGISVGAGLLVLVLIIGLMLFL